MEDCMINERAGIDYYEDPRDEPDDPADDPALLDLLDPPFDLWSAHDEDLVDAPPPPPPADPAQGGRLLVMARRPEPAVVLAAPKRSLGDHIKGVERIAQYIQALDPDDLSADAYAELSALLIGELAGTREKVDNVGRALHMFESIEASAKRERERLEKREQWAARQAERLTEYVLAVLDASNIPKLDGETSTLTARKNPPAVQIDEPAAVPGEYMRTPRPPAAPDKTLIKNALLAGIDVPGCRLEQRRRLVRS